MSFGLLVRDAVGNTVIDPDTFTVRLVRTVAVGSGVWSSPLRVNVPGVTAQMFGTAVPSYQLATDAVYTGRYERQGSFIGVDMPAVRTGDGYVELYPPMAGGSFMGGVIIYVFTNI
ncbi:hypothetical protein [Pseudomonas anguilliseptica]|uniref:hypothetical protein n=1 Tax=Pseudomonas anguilliseptica TaxID=53406 RepID=UPI00325B53B7